jgi:hypothetical protein
MTFVPAFLFASMLQHFSPSPQHPRTHAKLTSCTDETVQGWDIEQNKPCRKSKLHRIMIDEHQK